MYEITTYKKTLDKTFPSSLVALAFLMGSLRRKKIQAHIDGQSGNVIYVTAIKGAQVTTFVVRPVTPGVTIDATQS